MVKLRNIEMLQGVYNPELDNSWMEKMRQDIDRNRWKQPNALLGSGYFTGSALRYIHFPHIDPEDPKKIRFVDNIIAGRKQRMTSMRIGRYLTKHFKDYIGDEGKILAEQQSIVYETAPIEVKFAETPDEIEWVYNNGPRSCMSKPLGRFQVPEHPCRMYSAGDLQVAYILGVDGKRVGARSVVWPMKKHWVRIYGDVSRLKSGLVDLGYEQVSSFLGARIVKKPYKNTFIMPYVDGNARYVTTNDRDHFILRDYSDTIRNQYEICSEWGYLYEPQQCCCVCEAEGVSTTESLHHPHIIRLDGGVSRAYFCTQHYKQALDRVVGSAFRRCVQCGNVAEVEGDDINCDPQDVWCAQCSSVRTRSITSVAVDPDSPYGAVTFETLAEGLRVMNFEE
jgi:hypothetical protein